MKGKGKEAFVVEGEKVEKETSEYSKRLKSLRRMIINCWLIKKITLVKLSHVPEIFNLCAAKDKMIGQY